ncbi:apolipoprotein N-acyltransferase [Marivita sp. S2033]|uniref:apolipoprotein N-acyltransferase n=1 Tax=Marivita sp. S2033 TaxID=3373187 RepID=UPI0039828712
MVIRVLAALGLGAVFALGQPPFDLWWLALIGLIALFILWPSDASPKAAAVTGWFFGVGYFTLSLHWILEPFQVDAAATGWMAPFALVGLAGGLALLWSAAFWGGRRLGSGPISIALCWTLMELARAYVLTGFPWGLVGYLWAPTPVAQWHAVIGPHGVTFATLVFAALAARAIVLRKWFAGAAALAFGAWFGGAWLMPPEQDLTERPVVRLVQPNAPQTQKWDPDYIPIFFDRQIDFTAQLPPPDLIVWPETSVPNLLQNADYALDVIADAAAGTPVVLGIQREEQGRYYNSLVRLDGDGVVSDIYDKHHLVPFGEYMPLAGIFAKFNILGLAARANAGYSPGSGPALVDLGVLGQALPLICYEAVFPQDAIGTQSRPSVLLQITNDAWFGTYAGPQQHLSQARLRAIEQGLPLIRVANTGISAVIDPAGRIIDAIALGRAGFIDVPVPDAIAPTPYSRTGDWGAVLVLLVAFAALIAAKRRAPH